jgi:hypothetical protein
MWSPCMSTQLLILYRKIIFGFTRIPDTHFLLVALTLLRHWLDLNTPLSLGVSPHRQKSRGLNSGKHAGQLTGPPVPVHYRRKGLVQELSDNEKKL